MLGDMIYKKIWLSHLRKYRIYERIIFMKSYLHFKKYHICERIKTFMKSYINEELFSFVKSIRFMKVGYHVYKGIIYIYESIKFIKV